MDDFQSILENGISFKGSSGPKKEEDKVKTKAKKTHTHFRTEANRAQYKYEKQGKNPYPRKNIAKFLKIPNFIHDIGNH